MTLIVILLAPTDQQKDDALIVAGIVIVGSLMVAATLFNRMKIATFLSKHFHRMRKAQKGGNETSDVQSQSPDEKKVESGLLSSIKVDPKTIRSLLEGSRKLLDVTKEIKSQLAHLPYNTAKEIPRSAFEIKGLLGSGNFGNVHWGEIKLDGKNVTKVVIKSMQGIAGKDQVQNFLNEIKIMGYVKRHLNLVNMVGSWTAELEKSRNIWLLIEFWEDGDLNEYLAQNKTKILSGKEQDPINPRILIKWAYHVSKGMNHLASIFIMHGNLAARNVRLRIDPLNGGCPVAMVADFGLPKNSNTTYQKENRHLAPWKWTALECLENDDLCLKSDVWSFMVLVWEIFSFGTSPYGYSDYEEVLESLKNGYRLPCPKGLEFITTWSPEKLYNKLSNICFNAEPNDRGSFQDIVEVLEGELTKDECNHYVDQSEAYESKTAQLFDKLSQQTKKVFKIAEDILDVYSKFQKIASN